MSDLPVSPAWLSAIVEGITAAAIKPSMDQVGWDSSRNTPFYGVVNGPLQEPLQDVAKALFADATFKASLIAAITKNIDALALAALDVLRNRIIRVEKVGSWGNEMHVVIDQTLVVPLQHAFEAYLKEHPALIEERLSPGLLEGTSINIKVEITQKKS